MKAFKKGWLIILILVVFLTITGYFLIRNISKRALPDYNKDLTIEGLYAPVEVYRDSFAIPHIYAANEHDLYLVSGYLLAEDRLWQMDLLRRVTQGRLSEIFGDDYIDTDLLLRSLRFQKKSERILQQADSATRNALEAFSAGINLYIQHNQRKLPPEFTILQYMPEAWDPISSLNLIGYMAWDLKAGWSELILSSVRSKVDSLRYQQIIPDLLRKQPTVYPLDDYRSFSELLPERLLHNAELQKLGVDVLDASNNWAVSGKKSQTGKPLLANDMHLGLNIPGIWYQMHLVVPGKLNVTGLALPGAPGIICGHNDSIAWGMTNTYVDNMDFYEEKLNPADADQYQYNGEWKQMITERTVIKTGKKTSVERLLRFTHRGPVISEFKKIKDRVITMHWVGDEMSDEMRTIMMLNRACNWNDFTSALRTFTSISQNVVYADVKGNIGLFCAAGIPVRKRDIVYGILPGDTSAYDWTGYIPFNELPFLYNPQTGYVASANNRTAPPDYPYHIGTWYSLPARYERIVQMLTDKEVLSVEDFKKIQLDQHSKLAEKYLPVILKALETYQTDKPNEKAALELLQKWDADMNVNSQAAAIFENVYNQMFDCTLEDELGETLFENFRGVTSVSRIALDQLIENASSAWFDNTKTTEKRETLSDMVICSFTGSVSTLESVLGNNPQEWQWGKMHRIKLAHPLATVKMLDRIFGLSSESYEVGGSYHTVSPYSYDIGSPYKVIHGASHRHIYDVSNWDHSFTIIPTGNSGIPASKHFCDQTEMYIQGRYHRDFFSLEAVTSHAEYHMRFIPQSASPTQ